MRDLIGRTLGHYRIVDKIGEGGMGEVYRAHDERLDRDVAIKVLPASVAQDPERIARFGREARAVAKLEHPNILAIYDFGTEEDVTYSVTELLDGETLRERLEGGALGWRKAAEIGASIAHGLAAAHGAGIIHRDLKPDNVFLTSDGRVKILDFGLARDVAAAGADETQSPTVSRYTDLGAVMGTAGYMSPEQVRGQAVDHRSDVFALGCVLYEMVSNRGPFHQDEVADCMAAILRDDPLPLTGGDTPEALGQIIFRCLEKTPNERFQSAAEVGAALRTLVAATRGPVPTPEPEAASIAVLPFANLSPDPEQEYFCDGMTEEIIADLSKIGSLRVISRTSAWRFKGTTDDISTVAAQLGVRYVLEGSVRKAGDKLRITAQLIDAAADAHLWAEKYSGTIDDVFEFQESVSRTIVDALELTLTPREEQRLRARPIQDAIAYDAYLKAKTKILEVTEDSVGQALRYLDRALEVVGDNALLYSQMSFAYWQLVNIGVKHDEFVEKAESLARKALEVDPESSEAHTQLGFISTLQGNPKQAYPHLKKALEINPHESLATIGMVQLLGFVGRTSAAASYCDMYVQIDPMGYWTNWARGAVPFYSGDFEQALRRWRECYELSPQIPASPYFYALALAYTDQFDAALPIIEQLYAAHPGNAFAKIGLMLRCAIQGDSERGYRELTPEFEATCRRDAQLSHDLACCFALLNAKQEALDWLENAVSRGFINYTLLAEKDSLLENLRGEKRFKKLMERVKYEWETFEV
jgi:non-specific serine/threonine protein kinase